MKLSFIPLLLGGKSISPEARQALRENRLEDAARVLMEQYGLQSSPGCLSVRSIGESQQRQRGCVATIGECIAQRRKACPE
jgi:hypothetical protein